MSQDHPSTAREGERAAITIRGIVVAIATISGWYYYHSIVVGITAGSAGTYVLSNYPMMAIMPFVLWLFLNVLLKRLFPWAALTRGELLTVFSVTWITGILPMWGWSDYWVAILGAPGFNATAENQWETLILPDLPWNAMPENSPRVVDAFWLGLPEGAPLPWDAWTGVMARWIGASVAMVVFGLGLMILFQRQWIEHEKLSFPLAQMPIDLTRGFDGPRRMPDLFYSRLFWVGFGIVFLPLLYNIGTWFSPGLPLIELYQKRYQVVLPQPLPTVTFRVLPIVLALTWLCPLDILGSLVLFYWLAVFKMGLMDQVGFTVGSAGQTMGSADILDLESYGAIFAVAAWSLWLARRHLREVAACVLHGAGDRREVRIYRAAVIAMVLSGIYVVGFGVSLGASVPVAAASLALMTVVFFVVSKLIAATGFTYLMASWANCKGAFFITELVGSSNLSTRNVVSFKLFTSNAFFGNMRIPAWPAIPHHLRIFSLRRQPFRVCAVVLAAFAAGSLVTSWSSIEVAYDQGGAVHLPYAFNVYPQIANLLNNPRVVDIGKWGIWSAGFVEAALLAFLRGRFHWFSLPPIGLAFQKATGPESYWFSLFIVWLVKLTVLRYGGARAYQAGKPLFYGIGIGYAAGVILSGFVDVIWFPVQGHLVHYK